MVSKVLFSSAKSVWETPKPLYEAQNKKHSFTLDAAANKSNAKCKRFLGPGSKLREDALKCKWGINERIWLNVPTTSNWRLTYKWVKKAIKESERGNLVVVLLPARTSTPWFHDLIIPYLNEHGWHLIEWIRGRLHFELDGVPSANGAPFPSFILTLDGRKR